jgi:hypothetical protein
MTYNTNAVTSRVSVLNGAKFAPGTYKSGQLLGRLTATGEFTAYNAAFDPDKDDPTGKEIVAAVCLNDVTVPAGGGNAPVARGEFIREGVSAVMAGLKVPVTLTDVIARQCWDAGIILN